MSFTYGYIREAVQAHIDLDEQETQAMNLQERYHIFANEAMQAICAVKPKYDYFKVKIVNDIEKVNNDANIYLIGTEIMMPDDFIAFAEKQIWAFIIDKPFNSEMFIKGYTQPKYNNVKKIRATNNMYDYTGRNTLTFYQEGEYWIPYKAIWYKFTSNLSDTEIIDMPNDIFLTIPIYIAAQALLIDHGQKALAKRTEFELALSRCSSTDFLDLKRITPSFK